MIAGADPVAAFTAGDGTRLSYRVVGEGSAFPVILLHGLFSNAEVNWVRYGHAARIAEAGFRVILPDLRGHGASDAPHDPARYPHDVLADDGLALLAHLGLADGDYDLGGYSLGARTALRMLVRGARPRRAVIAGMGLDGMLDPQARAGFFRTVLEAPGAHPRGSPAFMAEAFYKTTGGDAAALLPLLDSFVATSRAELAALALPALICAGEEDRDNGSARALADAIPGARYEAIPGNHMSAVTKPALGAAIANFLAG